MEIKDIKHLIQENYNTYKSLSRITADYIAERSLTEAYNGRQILEMLQNCDDAQTDRVGIFLDKENAILRIANNGVPFAIEGLASLMLAHNSSKNKRQYIGNKGLGFRSILNWVEKVRIHTRECSLEFSRLIAKEEFDRLVPPDERKSLCEKVEDLPSGDVPFATLAVPKYYAPSEELEWQTVIELSYDKKYEEDIVGQLESIRPEVLLFLNHIQEISIDAESLQSNICKSPVENNSSQISISDQAWNIYDSKDKFHSSAKQFYRFKIAWQEDLSDNGYFATYFPTQVPISLPMLIHATFELDPSRNYLNNSDYNTFLLGEIASQIGTLATTNLRNLNDPDWNAFAFLTCSATTYGKYYQAFYQAVSNAQANLEVYPTLGKGYCRKEKVCFYGNDFSLWVQRNGMVKFFPYLLKPVDFNLDSRGFKNYSPEEFRDAFTSAMQHPISIDERVNLFKILTGDQFKVMHDTHLPLLLDQDQKVASYDTEVFTLKKGDTDKYKTPSFAAIAFIDESLYRALNVAFLQEINENRLDAKEDRSRALKRILSKIVNIGSNDITDVVRNITRSFNQEVERSPEHTEDYVKAYVGSLFEIFQRKTSGEPTAVDTIRLLNKKRELVLSSDLFLGEGFVRGNISKTLFAAVSDEGMFLIGNTFWQLATDNQAADNLDNFFIWLGVNTITKLKIVKATSQKAQPAPYHSHVFGQIGWPGLYTSITSEVQEVDYLQKFIKAGLSLEYIVAWILCDSRLNQKLMPHDHGDKLSHSYYNTHTYVSEFPSYFVYQVQKSGLLDNIIVELEFADQIGLRSFNFEEPVFMALKLDKTAILNVLKRLGAKMSVGDMGPQEIYRLLDKLQLHKYKSPRKIYQQAFNAFKGYTSEKLKPFKRQSYLMGVRNEAKEYRPTSEIYYSDNTTLPSQLIEGLWILDFPKRNGERQIADIFGVRTFRTLVIDIVNSERHSSQQQISEWFKKIKPFLLTYRLDDINAAGVMSSVAQTLKNCQINIVASLQYKVNDNAVKDLQPNEFVRDSKHSFYLAAEHGLTLEQLKDTPAFCEAFAEILCVVFEVNDNKDNFRSVFRDRETLKDSRYLIETKYLTDKYADALNLLGVSQEETSFWNGILQDKGGLPTDISDPTELESHIFKVLGYKLPEEYINVSFASFDTVESVDFLLDFCSYSGRTLEEISKSVPHFPGIELYHLEHFRQVLLDIEVLWNVAWWEYLSGKGRAEQSALRRKLSEYGKIRNQVAEDSAHECRFLFNIDYKSNLVEALAKKAGIPIKIKYDNLTLKMLYGSLLAQYHVQLEELPSSTISLFYFPGHEAVLHKQLQSYISEKEAGEQSQSIEPEVNASTVILNTVHLRPGTAPASESRKKDRASGWTYDQRFDNNKKAAGDRAETIVLGKLKERYPEGEFREYSKHSKDLTVLADDTIGYDIAYKKNKKDATWFLLEVKSSNGSSFIISDGEVTVGLQHSKRYHLALVHKQEISFVEDFFSDETNKAEFERLRSSSYVRPLEYEIFYKLPTLDKQDGNEIVLSNITAVSGGEV